MLDAVLRSNFLIPSAMALDRTRVLRVDGFRGGFHGVEDMDLWIRLLLGGARFVGTDDVIATYRIHEASLSTNTDAMGRAWRAVTEDLFGPEVGDPPTWSPAKRRAWGGYHRYCALTSVLRAGDYESAAEPLRRALTVDPSLVEDGSLFHELALGSQPVGWRGTRERIDVRANSEAADRLLAQVFERPNGPQLTGMRRRTYRSACRELANVAWNVGEAGLSRQQWIALAKRDGRSVLTRGWWRGFLRTLAPRRLVDARRARSGSVPTTSP